MSTTVLRKAQQRRGRSRSGNAAQDQVSTGGYSRRARYAWGELPLVRLEDAHGPIVNVRLPELEALDYSRAHLLHLMRTHEMVNACVRIRADRLVDPRLIVERSRTGETWTEDADHPLLSLVRIPGETLDTASFWRFLSTCWDSVGVVYLEPIKVNGFLWGVNPLDPQFLTEYYTPGGALDYLEWYPGYGERVIYQPNQLITRRRALNIDPSPLMSALGAVEADLAFSEYIRAFFSNSGIPPGIIKIHGDASKEVADDIKDKWVLERGRGGRYANAPAVMDDTADYQEIGSKLQELDNESLRQFLESRIAMPFQIPPIILYSYLGLSRAIDSNVEGAWSNFWRSPVLSILSEWSDWLTRSVLPYYERIEDIWAGLVRVSFDTSEIPALQDDIAPNVTMHAEAYKDGVVSVNEYRAALRLDPVADGNVVKAIEPEPEPTQPMGPAMVTASEAAADAAAALDRQEAPEESAGQKASPSVLERHVADYLRGEYAKARRQTLAGEPLDLDDGLQLTAMLAPSIRRAVERAYWAQQGQKAVARPQSLIDAIARAVERLGERAKQIAQTTRERIQGARTRGEDLVVSAAHAMERATTIVETETQTAHATGQLQALGDGGTTRVRWTTAGDPCPECQTQAGTEYALGSAPTLPAHPNCACRYEAVEAV